MRVLGCPQEASQAGCGEGGGGWRAGEVYWAVRAHTCALWSSVALPPAGCTNSIPGGQINVVSCSHLHHAPPSPSLRTAKSRPLVHGSRTSQALGASTGELPQSRRGPHTGNMSSPLWPAQAGHHSNLEDSGALRPDQLCHLEQLQPTTPYSSPYLHSTATQARTLDNVTPPPAPNQTTVGLGVVLPLPFTLRQGQPWNTHWHGPAGSSGHRR